MSDTEHTQQDTPPWKRRPESAPAEDPSGDSGELKGILSSEDLSTSEHDLQELARANDRASRVQVVENFENLFFHDDFFRLVGIGAVGGFAISSILIVIVLEFTDREFSGSFPDFWYLFPTLTIVGFVAWTILLLKVRVHRRDKRLREIAFGGEDQESEDVSKDASGETRKEPPGPRHSEPGEQWL